MSEQKIIEARAATSAVQKSLDAAMGLVNAGIPFVAVPCVTPEHVDAALVLSFKHAQDIEDSHIQVQKH